MDFDKSVDIVAIARMLGSKEPAKAILDKYSQYRQEVLKEFAENAKSNTVEVFKNPLWSQK